jgi:hypothetical protein
MKVIISWEDDKVTPRQVIDALNAGLDYLVEGDKGYNELATVVIASIVLDDVGEDENHGR